MHFQVFNFSIVVKPNHFYIKFTVIKVFGADTWLVETTKTVKDSSAHIIFIVYIILPCLVAEEWFYLLKRVLVVAEIKSRLDNYFNFTANIFHNCFDNNTFPCLPQKKNKFLFLSTFTNIFFIPLLWLGWNLMVFRKHINLQNNE